MLFVSSDELSLIASEADSDKSDELFSGLEVIYCIIKIIAAKTAITKINVKIVDRHFFINCSFSLV